jgi:hypothetical protein
MLEQRKADSRALNAEIRPLSPAKTGEKVMFDATGSSPGLTNAMPDYYWSFGDGAVSTGEKASHVFQQPGIYPVTLTIYDGVRHATTTHHIVINGEQTSFQELRIVEKDKPSFYKRHAWETDVYNHENAKIPNSVRFSFPHRAEAPVASRSITLNFLNGKGFPGDQHRIEVNYVHGQDWLNVELGDYSPSDNSMTMEIKPDITRMNKQEGESVAHMIINDDAFINSPQMIRIVAKFSRPSEADTVIIDDLDAGCVKSNYFWLTSKLDRPWCKPNGGSFLVGAGFSDDGFVRYHPKLPDGKYKVSLLSPLYEQDVVRKSMQGFYVNIHSKSGIETKWMNPNESLLIGTFDFYSCDGYVEIISKGSKGLVIADAIAFERIL